MLPEKKKHRKLSNRARPGQASFLKPQGCSSLSYIPGSLGRGPEAIDMGPKDLRIVLSSCQVPASQTGSQPKQTSSISHGDFLELLNGWIIFR